MNPELIKNYLAAGAIGANLIVKLSADGQVVKAAAAADFSIGLSTNIAVDSGERCDVIHGGIGFVVAGAPIARGAFVTSDAAGKAITATDGERTIGQVLEAAGALNDVVPILIAPGGFAGASVAGVDAHAIHDNPGGDQTIAGNTALINAGGFTGPLTGAVTGNVTGNASGYAGGLKDAVTDIAVNGAIAAKTGTVTMSKAGVLAATLADPATPADDGKRLTIIATTANAHTVSNAAGSGFNAGGAGSDVATFGGAIGDCLELIALGGKWLVTSMKNVTLG